MKIGKIFIIALMLFFINFLSVSEQLDAKNFIFKASQGDAHSQYMLGLCYYHGYGIKKDLQLALLNLRRSVEQNYAPAQYFLGKYYLQGKVIERNTEQALILLKKSAEQNYADALFELGCLYRNGDIYPKDYKIAESYFQKASSQNHKNSQIMLFFIGFWDTKTTVKKFEKLYHGVIENNGESQYQLALFYLQNGGEKYYDKVIEYLKKSSDNNYWQAQYKLCEIYTTGQIVEKNYLEAEKYLSLAEKNTEFLISDKQMYEIGALLCRDLNNKKNFSKGINYLKRAAELNNSNALWILAYYNNQGINMPVNYAEAVKYATPLAQKGHVDAKLILGRCYLGGLGVKADYEKGFKYLVEVSQKYPEVQLLLADCYLNGIGTSKNPQKAIEIYENFAKNGDIQANYKLGLCYKDGVGVEKNHFIAYNYFKNAAEREHLESMLEVIDDLKERVVNRVNYYTSKQVAKYRQEIIFWLEKAKEKNHPASMRNLADYYKGEILTDEQRHWSEQIMKKEEREVKKQKVLSLYRKAAELGDELAWEELGNCYKDGIFVEKNFEQAIKCYEKCTKVCHAANLQAVVDYYHYGNNKNEIEYIKWLTFLANSSNNYSNKQYVAKALDLLSSYYLLGTHGVNKNLIEAEKYCQILVKNYPYSEHAKQGYWNLAKIYRARNDEEQAEKYQQMAKTLADRDAISKKERDNSLFRFLKEEALSDRDTDGKSAVSLVSLYRERLSDEEYLKYLHIAVNKGNAEAKFLWEQTPEESKQRLLKEEQERISRKDVEDTTPAESKVVMVKVIGRDNWRYIAEYNFYVNDICVKTIRTTNTNIDLSIRNVKPGDKIRVTVRVRTNRSEVVYDLGTALGGLAEAVVDDSFETIFFTTNDID